MLECAPASRCRSPCHNVCTILTSIQSLLTDPNCASPANPDAAQLYTNNRWAAALMHPCPARGLAAEAAADPAELLDGAWGFS